jgi:hypothetical protein
MLLSMYSPSSHVFPVAAHFFTLVDYMARPREMQFQEGSLCEFSFSVWGQSKRPITEKKHTDTLLKAPPQLINNYDKKKHPCFITRDNYPRPKMVANSFGNKSLMPPMRRLSMHS